MSSERMDSWKHEDRSSSGCDCLLSSRTLRSWNHDRISIWRQNLLMGQNRERNQQTRHGDVGRDSRWKYWREEHRKPVAKARPQQTSNSTLSSVSIPYHERKWMDVEPGTIDQNCLEVPKLMIRLLWHDDSVNREEDGAVKIEDLASIFRSRIMSSSHWSIRTWLSFLQRGGGMKKRFQYCVDTSATFEQFKTILKLHVLILHCKTTWCCRTTSPSRSITLEAPMTYTTSSSLDWFCAGRLQEKEACGVLYGRKSELRWSAQRSRVRPDESQDCSVQKSLENTQNYSLFGVIWRLLKGRIAVLWNTVHSNHLAQDYLLYASRKCYTWSQEENCTTKCIRLQDYRKEPYSSRICIMDVRILPIFEARTPVDHQSKDSEEYGETRSDNNSFRGTKEFGETRSGNVDFRIQGLPHSTVQKQDDIRRETFKRLIHQFETHPNREALKADRKHQKSHPLSEKSKELIRSMRNTEYFEMCEITSKLQCQDCLLFWEIGIVFCTCGTCGTCLRPSQKNHKLNKDRFDVLSIPNYAIKKVPSHGARHGPTERQWICFIAHNAARKARRKGYTSTLDRFKRCQLYRGDSQTKVVWDEIICAAFDRIRGPLLHCAKMGTKQKRKLVEARAKLGWCNWTRWLQRSKENVWQAVQGTCSSSSSSRKCQHKNSSSKSNSTKTGTTTIRRTWRWFLLCWFGNIIHLQPPRILLLHHSGGYHSTAGGQHGIGILHHGMSNRFFLVPDIHHSLSVHLHGSRWSCVHFRNGSYFAQHAVHYTWVDQHLLTLHPHSFLSFGCWEHCYALSWIGFGWWGKFVLCWHHHCTCRRERRKCGPITSLSLCKRKLSVKFISSSEEYGETRRVVFKQQKIESRNIFWQRRFFLRTSTVFKETTSFYFDSLIRKKQQEHSLENVKMKCLQKHNLKCEGKKAGQIFSTVLFVIFRDTLIPIAWKSIVPINAVKNLEKSRPDLMKN